MFQKGTTLIIIKDATRHTNRQLSYISSTFIICEPEILYIGRSDSVYEFYYCIKRGFEFHCSDELKRGSSYDG